MIVLIFEGKSPVHSADKVVVGTLEFNDGEYQPAIGFVSPKRIFQFQPISQIIVSERVMSCLEQCQLLPAKHSKVTSGEK